MKLNVSTLEFSDLWKKSIINVWKLVELLRFQFIYYKVITGKGIEFDRLREYTEEDDAKFIDWNSYARSGKPHVKIFKEERMLDIVYIVDLSTTMTLGTTEIVKNEYASILATTLALVSHTLGDRVCMIGFSDEIKVFIDPSTTIDTVLQIAKVLTDKNIYGGNKRWGVITPAVLETFGPDSFIFILSDFIGPKQELYDFVMKASNKFEGVAGIMIRDPLDSYIPEGIGKIYIQDPSSGEIALVDADKIRKEFNENAKKEEQEINNKFISSGALFTKVYTTEKDIVKVILNLFGERIWK
ncbi:MAG TPA: DUF58 domain-containing protein [Nanoarchaeota archaeon]|nr:DUF58 domain-containing protein [Nanoarchaeota archaeon]